MSDADSATPVSPALSDPSVLLSSNRTSMSLERTAMAADSTLMSIIRTSLSLIGFGFTIFQFFKKVADSGKTAAVTESSARHFGSYLVILGIGLLAAGLVVHWRSTRALRERRERLFSEGLLRRGYIHQSSPSFITGVLLLLVGLASIVGMIARLGPLR